MTNRLIILTAVIATSTTLPAVAGTSTAVQSFVSLAYRDCQVRNYKQVFQGTMEGSDQPVVVATFNVEGCGGGNNGNSVFGIYSEGFGGIRELKLTPPIPGAVQTVNVTARRIGVKWMEWKPSDPRCCPSLPRQAAYVLRNGQAVLAP